MESRTFSQLCRKYESEQLVETSAWKHLLSLLESKQQMQWEDLRAMLHP